MSKTDSLREIVIDVARQPFAGAAIRHQTSYRGHLAPIKFLRFLDSAPARHRDELHLQLRKNLQ